jgi:hypothetical protein
MSSSRPGTAAQHGDSGVAAVGGAAAVHRQEEEEELQAMPAETVHRAVIADYKFWVKKQLSRGFGDWAVADEEALKVVRELGYLSDGDLLDTYNRMQADGLWARLSEQAPSHSKTWHDLRWRLVRLEQPVLGKGSDDKRLAKLKSALSASERGSTRRPDWRKIQP